MYPTDIFKENNFPAKRKVTAQDIENELVKDGYYQYDIINSRNPSIIHRYEEKKAKTFEAGTMETKE